MLNTDCYSLHYCGIK